MKHLYRTEHNYSNIYIVEDWEKDKAIVVDWDLNEVEEQKLIEHFENNTLVYEANGGEWLSIEEAYTNCYSKNLLRSR